MATRTTLSICLVILMAVVANAFNVVVTMPTSSSVVSRSSRIPSLMMSSTEPSPGGDGEEGEGFDLDLGEMFEMFDAADKETDFDDAIKKVKGEKGN